jgi:hypothetical protein
MQRSEITDDDEHEWIVRVGKTAYNLVCNRTNNDFIIKSSDPILLGYIELAINQYLDAIPFNLRPTFQQMLDDIKTMKEKLER